MLIPTVQGSLNKVTNHLKFLHNLIFSKYKTTRIKINLHLKVHINIYII